MRPLPLLLAASLLAGPARAENPALAAAHRAVAEVNYKEALRQLERAEQLPGNDRATLLELYVWRGVAAATLGQDQRAQEAFRVALSIDPECPLPEHQPPRVRTPYLEAKQWVASMGALAFSAEREGGELLATVRTDPLGLGKRVRFTTLGATAAPVELALREGQARAPLAPGAGWSVELLDAHGGVLSRLEEAPPPPAAVAQATPSASPPPADAPAPPVAAVNPAAAPQPNPSAAPTASPTGTIVKHVPPGWMWPVGLVTLGVGGAAAIAGGAIGAQVADAQARVRTAERDANGVIVSLTQREAARLDQLARSGAPVANVLLFSGLGVAAAGFALFLVGIPPEKVAVLPGPAGVAVVGSFD